MKCTYIDLLILLKHGILAALHKYIWAINCVLKCHLLSSPSVERVRIGSRESMRLLIHLDDPSYSSSEASYSQACPAQSDIVSTVSALGSINLAEPWPSARVCSHGYSIS